MKIENYEVNKIYQDEFGRISGVFAADKPVGKTSHDMVYEYRKKFNTKKVGHAGALDPFASGLLIILVGKATKLSDKFLNMDKEYIADIAFGITTETLDPEGTIKISNEQVELDQELIKKSLQSFQPEYEQYVPIYSSVKVNGQKLRELARKNDSYEIYDDKVKFIKEGNITKEIELPKKVVKIYEIELVKNTEDLELADSFKKQMADLSIQQLNTITVRVKCSKGTYIRKLAEDIGDKLNTPAMLVGLRRTQIGEISTPAL